MVWACCWFILDVLTIFHYGLFNPMVGVFSVFLLFAAFGAIKEKEREEEKIRGWKKNWTKSSKSTSELDEKD